MLKLRFVNKEHGDVWLVEPSVLIGADAACQVTLKQDGIKLRHADIQIKGNQLTLINLAEDAGLTINGKVCNKQSPLSVGDQIVIGGMKLILVDPKDERKLLADVKAASGWAIRPNHSALANKIYSINGDTVLGRAAECDLSFSVAHMSRKHAQLSILNGQLMVRDLESANGTFVNGKQIKESKLNKGDELRLDTLSFTVIGPGGDADKTTMRMAVTLPPASVSAAKAVAPAPRPAPVTTAPAAEREKKRAAGTTTFQKAIVASEEAKHVQEVAGSKINSIVVAVILIAIIGVVTYMFV